MLSHCTGWLLASVAIFGSSEEHAESAASIRTSVSLRMDMLGSFGFLGRPDVSQGRFPEMGYPLNQYE